MAESKPLPFPTMGDYRKLEDAATKVVQLSHIGDQNFIRPLSHPDCMGLRAAIVELAELLRGECDE